MHALLKSKFLGEAQQHHCPFMLFMVNYVPCRKLESKKLEPKSLLGFLPLQFLIVFSLQSKPLSARLTDTQRGTRAYPVRWRRC
jgi:hypothetical protein